LCGVFLSLSALLFWYGTCVNRIAAKDLDFAFKHQSTNLFSTPWVWRGNWAYQVELNPAAAIPFYREAISRQVLNLDAWFLLAQMELAEGNTETPRKILQFLSEVLSQVSTWKWNELLLSHDLNEEIHFSKCFNFILSRLPHRIRDASYVAQKFWGDWMQIIPHVDPENHAVFLKTLMQEKEVDAALALWEILETEHSLPERELILRFSQFLLGQARVEAAKNIWFAWRNTQTPGIYNGGFEQAPLNTSFGWKFNRHRQVDIERSSLYPYEGRYSLHLHFTGTSNVSFHHVSHVVPVEPGKTYRLLFAQKTQNITTDQGVFLQVSGYQCKGPGVRSEPLMGTTSWNQEEMEFQVPDECHALLLQVRRKESLMFDNKILGDYWLDAVQLIPV
jgi:hypothetical protein